MVRTARDSPISDRTQILGIGSGTGIVPVLSLLKSHINSLLLWEPEMYLRERAEADAENRHFAEEYRKESRYRATAVNLAPAIFTETNKKGHPNLPSTDKLRWSDTNALASPTDAEEDGQCYEEIL